MEAVTNGQEVLVLREREAGLRQRLMEHWSGVMAWEVRRLEQASSQAQAKCTRQSHQLSQVKDREGAMRKQFKEIEMEMTKKHGRVEELEEMVVEMGRRERAIEEEVRELDQVKSKMEQDRQRTAQETDRERARWAEERRGFEEEKRRWHDERQRILGEKESVVRERQILAENGQMSARDKAVMDRIRQGLGGILSRKAAVGEGEIIDALEDVKKVVDAREKEIGTLKEEMREVNMGLEEEVKRMASDRDAWKVRAEKADASRKEEIMTLSKKIRVSLEFISCGKQRQCQY
jgi:hypothetical protein